MKAFSTEAGLAAVVVSWLNAEGWEVFQEVVGGGGVIDIVARRPPLTWAIETKLAFGTAVLEQARANMRCASLVSVATPYARHPGVLDEYCHWKGIGWLVVKPLGSYGTPIEERIPAMLRRRLDGKLTLHEQQKTACAAGSQGGHWTPFKETCRKVRDAVRARPGMTLKELLTTIETHYHSPSAARANIAHWAAKGVIAGVEIQNEAGRLKLYPKDAA